MALKKCKECGKEVSTKAKNCPNCGAPAPNTARTLMNLGCALMILVPVLIILLLIIFGAFAQAHSGRTDAQGGHYNRKTGEYHYHNRKPVNTPTSILPSPQKSAQKEGIKTTIALVTRVIDGDTIVVEVNGLQEKVRLLRIDTPEIETPAGKICKAYLQGLVEGKIVTLEHKNIRDKYGRLLADVYVGGGNIRDKIKVKMRELAQ